MIKIKIPAVISIVIIMFSLYIIIYLAGTLNFCMGSNCEYYNTAFDYESEWFCEEYKIHARRINENYIELSSELSEEKYVIRKMNHITVGLQSYSELGEYCDSQIFCYARMKSYKKWWNLHKFKLILGDNYSLYGGDELLFIRK